MAWQRGEQWWSWAHIGDGERRQISLGTTSSATAKEIERMLDILRGRRAWRLVRAAVVEGVITLGALFDAFREGEHALQRIEAGLDDADLNQHVAGWQPWARKRASAKQVGRYVQMLRVLIPEGKPFPRSSFTRKLVSQALSGLPGTGSTGRRYYTAWSQFGNYLVEIEVLAHNPVKDVKAPRENDPRENFLDLPDVKRLVDAQEEPFRTLAALREAAGVEISAALKVRVRDLGEGAQIVQAAGTKNAWRNRPVYVEPWARPYLLQLAKGKLPDAKLFDGVDYWDAIASHRSALKALGLPKDYTLHDARHSFAVRWMRAGIDPNLIAANLGHKNAMLVLKVYGKYRPRALDLARLDVEKFGCSSGDSAAPAFATQVA